MSRLFYLVCVISTFMNKKIFIAKVSDNQDPDSLNRVKVTFTHEQETVTSWAPISLPVAGDENGFSCLPEVDDQVLVTYVDNDVSELCVIGSIWSSDIKPPESEENSDADFNQDGNNSLNFVKSRSGNKIILDDTDSKEKIQIITSDSKSRFEFSKEDELINLETETDIQMSAKSDLSFDAEEIEFSSEKQTNVSSDEFQAEISKESEISADKDMTLKGSGISLN